MQDYYQPDFYHFSEDSIHVTKHALNCIGEKREALSVIDLCCGSGVVGFEIWKMCDDIEKIVFLELQNEFREFWDKNLQFCISSREHHKASFFQGALSVLLSDNNFNGKFDLIVSNTPYFEKGKGRLSPNLNKNICRFFLFDNKIIFFEVISFLLKENGKAIISLRENLTELPISTLRISKKIKHHNCYVFELEHC